MIHWHLKNTLFFLNFIHLFWQFFNFFLEFCFLLNLRGRRMIKNFDRLWFLLIVFSFLHYWVSSIENGRVFGQQLLVLPVAQHLVANNFTTAGTVSNLRPVYQTKSNLSQLHLLLKLPVHLIKWMLDEKIHCEISITKTTGQTKSLIRYLLFLYCVDEKTLFFKHKLISW